MTAPDKTARRALTTALGVIVLAFVLRAAREHLTGYSDPSMAAWPGQVIFGFYFVVIVVAVQTLQSHADSGASENTRQVLLPFILLGLCLDLVLVNVQEVIRAEDASYGLVVIWDTATFFVWVRAAELCKRERVTAFDASIAVRVAPLFALGREILFLKFPLDYASRSFADIIFGNVAVCLFVFIGDPRVNQRTRSALTFVIVASCVYWLCNAIENIAVLAWSPLDAGIRHAFASIGLGTLVLSYAYAMVGIATAFILRRRDPRGFASRLGLATAPRTLS